MFLKVLSHLILKIKSFMKYLKKGLEILQNFHEIFKYFKVKYFIVHLQSQAMPQPQIDQTLLQFIQIWCTCSGTPAAAFQIKSNLFVSVACIARLYSAEELRSLKIIGHVTVRYSAYDFLLPFHSNYGPVLHRFPHTR